MDDRAESNTATVTVTIVCDRRPPVAVNDEATTDEGVPVNIRVLSNDIDPERQPPTPGQGVELVPEEDQPDNNDLIPGASITYNDDGTITYNPANNYCADVNGDRDGGYMTQYDDTFDYTIKDDDELTATAEVTVTVLCDVNAPQPEDDEAETTQGTPVDIDVLGNDVDPDGGDLDVFDFGDPELGDGATTTDGPGDTIKYTPGTTCEENPSLTQYVDVFTYEAVDTNDDNIRVEATVTVTVICDNRAPIAQDDTRRTPEDTPIDIDVLSNDQDPEGAPLRVSDITDMPGNGEAKIINNIVEYTPNPNFCGDDSFVYEVADLEGLTDSATVNIIVECVNDNPNAVNDQDFTLQDVAVTTDVLANDSDPDEEDTLIVVSVTDPPQGTAVINNDNTITYTPDPDYCGEDVYQYTNEDESGLQSTATVDISIACAAPTPEPPTAVDDSAVTDEQQTVRIPVLDNDDDPDGDNDLLLIQRITKFPGKGSVSINPDRTISYTPNAGICGTDSFRYRVIDPQGQISRPAVVRITIRCDEHPIATPDEYTTDEGTSVDGSVLDNDSDPEGGDIELVDYISKPNPSTEGTVTPIGDESDGKFRFTPVAGFCGKSVSFKYVMQDSIGQEAESTVTITVNCRQDPCECYGLELQSGPTVSKYLDRVCYRYKLKRNSNKGICAQKLSYWVLEMNNDECGIDDDEYKLESIRPNGKLIDFTFDRSDIDGAQVSGSSNGRDRGSETFNICFNKYQVGGTQSSALVGFKQGDEDYTCEYQNIVPDFCGGLPELPAPGPVPNSPRPTPRPTAGRRPSTPSRNDGSKKSDGRKPTRNNGSKKSDAKKTSNKKYNGSKKSDGRKPSNTNKSNYKKSTSKKSSDGRKKVTSTKKVDNDARNKSNSNKKTTTNKSNYKKAGSKKSSDGKKTTSNYKKSNYKKSTSKKSSDGKKTTSNSKKTTSNYKKSNSKKSSDGKKTTSNSKKSNYKKSNYKKSNYKKSNYKKSGSKKSSDGKRSRAQSVISELIQPQQETKVVDEPETFMDKYAPYIIIGIITILFNIIAYGMAYMCCIKKSILSGSSGNAGFVEAKVLDESDVTDDDDDDEINEHLNQDV